MAGIRSADSRKSIERPLHSRGRSMDLLERDYSKSTGTALR